LATLIAIQSYKKPSVFYRSTTVFFSDYLPIRQQFIVLTAVKGASITYLRGGGEKNTGGTTGRPRIFFAARTPS
jgi:hypothetical protein